MQEAHCPDDRASTACESGNCSITVMYSISYFIQVVFSPDTRFVASASFDKSVKIWCGRTGKYLASLRGHVQAVYQVFGRFYLPTADSTKIFDFSGFLVCRFETSCKWVG